MDIPLRRSLALLTISLFLFKAMILFAEEGWETGAPVPRARGEGSAAVLDGKIYLVGGFTVFGVTSRLDVYDPAADLWEEKAPLPAALHHVGIATANGKLYVIGGFDGLIFWTPVRSVWEYNPKTDEWLAKEEMPTARGALGAAALEGKVYAVGGFGETPFGKGNIEAVEVYDPAADRWETKSPLPVARDHLAVVAARGKIHAIGGRLHGSYARNLSSHDLYDPETDQWRSAAPLLRPRSGIAAAVLQEKIFVFGGESIDGVFSSNDAYYPETDQWKPAPPMPTARHGLAAAAVENKIYVITGGTRPGGSISDLNEIFRTD